MAKILLSGYYGFDNAGDEAVLYSIINSLVEVMGDRAEIVVLSNQPEQTKAVYGVSAVDRWDKRGIYRAIRGCDLLISGGGSLLQDVTSKNGILYYLGIIWLAKKLKKKVMIYAQGIGPINEPRNRQLTARVLSKVDGITVRDFNSRLELINMGLKGEIQVSVDPVLGINSHLVDEKLGQQLLMEAGDAGNLPRLIVAVRSWEAGGEFLHRVAAACDHFASSGWQVILLPMHFPEDMETGVELAGLMKEKAVILRGNYSPKETLEIIKNGDLILGMRLHALIMGVALRKPIVALSYDPKVDGFMQSLKLSQCVPIDGLKSEDIIGAVDETWQGRAEYIEKLLWRMEIIAQQAKAPAVMAATLLNLSREN